MDSESWRNITFSLTRSLVSCERLVSILSEWFSFIYLIIFYSTSPPYYKLAYIKLAWGGPVEQAAEIAAENPEVKNWQAEAKKNSRKSCMFYYYLLTITILTGTGNTME